VAIIYLITFAMHIPIRTEPMAVLGVLGFVMLGSAVFSTFSLIIACIVKTRERFMGIGQVLTMPLFFASNAIYPLSLMPEWLKSVASANPLTYLVDALRTLMVAGSDTAHSLTLDFSVLAIVFVSFVVIAAKLYPTLIE
jgi:ABC-2 type transport system permease protein